MTFLGVVWLITKVLYFLGVAVLADLFAQDGERYVEITHPLGRYRLVRFFAYTVVAMLWPLFFILSLRFVPSGGR